MIRRNNIVVGGTACGPKAAARARRCDPLAKITIIEQGEDLSTATCGLPYYVAGVINSQSDLVARKHDFFRDVMNMEVLTSTKALAIDRETHKVEILNLQTNHVYTIGYDKLVLATGGVPAVPHLEGANLRGIFTLGKIEDAIKIRELIAPKRNLLQYIFPNDEIHCWIITNYSRDLGVSDFTNTEVFRMPKYKIDPNILRKQDKSSKLLPPNEPKYKSVYELQYRAFHYFRVLKKIHKQVRIDKPEKVKLRKRIDALPDRRKPDRIPIYTMSTCNAGGNVVT